MSEVTSKPKSADELFPGRRPHARDTAMIFLNKLLPIPPHMLTLATGLLLGGFLPAKYAAAGALLALTPSVYRLLKEVAKPLGQRDSDKYIKKGRYAASIEGDFCVLLIGARYNGPSKLNTGFGWMGEAMGDIVRDLQANAEETGYLNHEDAISTEKNGTDTLLVVYFRSFDHLTRYARSRSNAHAGPWTKLLGMGRRDPSFGFWHESFKGEGERGGKRNGGKGENRTDFKKTPSASRRGRRNLHQHATDGTWKLHRSRACQS